MPRSFVVRSAEQQPAPSSFTRRRSSSRRRLSPSVRAGEDGALISESDVRPARLAGVTSGESALTASCVRAGVVGAITTRESSDPFQPDTTEGEEMETSNSQNPEADAKAKLTRASPKGRQKVTSDEDDDTASFTTIKECRKQNTTSGTRNGDEQQTGDARKRDTPRGGDGNDDNVGPARRHDVTNSDLADTNGLCPPGKVMQSDKLLHRPTDSFGSHMVGRREERVPDQKC
jgi:hypothetical protein